MQEDTIETCVKCAGGLVKKTGTPTVAIEMWPNKRNIVSDPVAYYHCASCMVDYFPKEALIIMTRKMEEIGGNPPRREHG